MTYDPPQIDRLGMRISTEIQGQCVTSPDSSSCSGLRGRVLLVDGASEFGGQQIHVLNLAIGLRASGVAVGLVCPEGMLAQKVSAQGISVFRERFASSLDLRTIKALTRLIRDQEFSIVHTHGTRAGVLGRVAARMARVPNVHTVHVMVTDIVRDSGPRGIVKRSVYELAERRLASIADVVICVSNGLRDKYQSVGVDAQKLRVIHNAVPMPRLEDAGDKRRARRLLGLSDEARVVAAVTRLCPGKGIECLIRAAACMSLKNVVFVIAGDGPLMQPLKELVVESGVADQFRFLGYLDDVGGVYTAADVFVLPSEAEGHPLSVLEAMAYARPVVASAVTGITESVVDGVTGLLTPSLDHFALARAIAAIVDSPGQAETMGRRGRERVESHFSLGRMLQQTQVVYSDLGAVV